MTPPGPHEGLPAPGPFWRASNPPPQPSGWASRPLPTLWKGLLTMPGPTGGPPDHCRHFRRDFRPLPVQRNDLPSLQGDLPSFPSILEGLLFSSCPFLKGLLAFPGHLEGPPILSLPS